MRHRVFIGLSEVAGYYGSLARAFESLGITTTFIDESDHPFRYGRRTWYGRMCRHLDRTRLVAASAGPAPKVVYMLLGAALWTAKLAYRTSLFLWALVHHDIFILGAGNSFLPPHDLQILRLLGKRVIVVFTGSDHRPPYLSGRSIREIGPTGFAPVLAETERVRDVVRNAERYAMQIVGLGSSGQFHSKPFAHFLAMGIPVDVRMPATSPASTPFSGHGVRVLHSPSDPINKGTDRVRRAIGSIRSRGVAIDYVEITGRPHAEVLRAIREADLIVDEVFSDTPMAILATEAAWLGKPVVVTGYYARHMETDLRLEFRPPTDFALPDQLESRIERLILDEIARRDLAQRARAFVEAHWQPDDIARRYLDLAEGRGRPEWQCNPASVAYIGGWGMPEDLLRSRLRQLIGIAGLPALGLSHAPILERNIMELTR